MIFFSDPKCPKITAQGFSLTSVTRKNIASNEALYLFEILINSSIVNSTLLTSSEKYAYGNNISEAATLHRNSSSQLFTFLSVSLFRIESRQSENNA